MSGEEKVKLKNNKKFYGLILITILISSLIYILFINIFTPSSLNPPNLPRYYNYNDIITTTRKGMENS